MSSILFIDTSASPYDVIITRAEQVVFNSRDHQTMSEVRDLPIIVNYAFRQIDITPADLTLIAVNVGPGGLSSIRSGVSFANALSFSLKIPVAPFSSFEMMGHELTAETDLPVLGTTRGAGKNVYACLFTADQPTVMCYGIFAEVVQELTADLDSFAVIGTHRAEIQALGLTQQIWDSERTKGTLPAMLAQTDLLNSRQRTYPQIAHPINEQTLETAL